MLFFLVLSFNAIEMACKSSISLFCRIWFFDILYLIFFFFTVLPTEGPRITGGKPRYQIGDKVSVNCTSGRSKPATHLTWFINGEPADPRFVRNYDTVITGREGLETTIMGLNFEVKPKFFLNGDMKLKVSIFFKLMNLSGIKW